MSDQWVALSRQMSNLRRRLLDLFGVGQRNSDAGVNHVALDRCFIRVAPDGSSVWRIDIDGILRSPLNQPCDILLEYAESLLRPESVFSDSATEVVQDVDARGRPAVRLKMDTSSQTGWDQALIHMVLRWRPGAAYGGGDQSTGLGRAPCLVLPDMLPRIAVSGDLTGGQNPGSMPRLTYAAALPDGLDAGGIAIPHAGTDPTREMLQMVIFPKSSSIHGNEILAVASTTTRELPADALEAAHRYVAPLLEFVRLELRVDLPTRSVICLVDAVDESVFPVSGAYCPVTPDQVGAETQDRGKPRGALTFLSCAWLGGGTRVWGDNAVELTLALGAALGLRWLQVAGHDAALQRALRDAADRVAAAERSGEWHIADVTRSIQLPLYEGMQSSETRYRIGRLIREYWGMYMPQEALVGLLRSTGTSVPNVFM